MSKRMAFVAAALVIAAMFQVSCNKENERKLAEEKAIADVLQKQMDFLTQKNIDGYMGTIDPSSPDYQKTKTVMGSLRDMTLTFKLDKAKLMELSEDGLTAKVEFVQTTLGDGSKDMRDNKVNGIHDMRKVDGKWTVTKTTIRTLEYLDGKK